MSIVEWILVLLVVAAVIGVPLLWAAFEDRRRGEEISEDLHEAAEDAAENPSEDIIRKNERF